jgi:hypothetical protein
MSHWMHKPPSCFLCTHWEEEARKRMREIAAEWVDAGADLSQIDGCAEEGECAEGIPGVNITVFQDVTTADATTDANFYCPSFTLLNAY